MPEFSLSDVEAALRAVTAARQKAVAAMNLHDPEDPSKPYDLGTVPPPADPKDVALLEETLGRPLPPSFRLFLSIRDGYADIDLGSDILPARKMAQFNERRAAAALRPILSEIERDSTDGLVVFGVTTGDKSMFIFDSNKSDEYGEWSALDYDAEEGLLDEYPNFVDFLTDMANTLNAMP